MLGFSEHFGLLSDLYVRAVFLFKMANLVKTKSGMFTTLVHPITIIYVKRETVKNKTRRQQGSNLRGRSPTDFKSVSLTTRT